MNAIEANKLARSIDNKFITKQRKRIDRKIKSAAINGRFFVTLYDYVMPDEIQRYYEEQGYTVKCVIREELIGIGMEVIEDTEIYWSCVKEDV